MTAFVGQTYDRTVLTVNYAEEPGNRAFLHMSQSQISAPIDYGGFAASEADAYHEPGDSFYVDTTSGGSRVALPGLTLMLEVSALRGFSKR